MTIKGLLDNFEEHGNGKYLKHLPTYLYNSQRYRELTKGNTEREAQKLSSNLQYRNFFTFMVCLCAYIADARNICESITQYIVDRGFVGYEKYKVGEIEETRPVFSAAIFEMLATNFGITLDVPEQDETTSQGMTQQYFYDALCSLEVKRHSFSTLDAVLNSLISTSSLVTEIRLLQDHSLPVVDKDTHQVVQDPVPMKVTLDLITEHYIDSNVLADIIVPRVTGVEFDASATPLDLPTFGFDTWVPSVFVGTWEGTYMQEQDNEKVDVLVSFVVTSFKVTYDNREYAVEDGTLFIDADKNTGDISITLRTEENPNLCTLRYTKSTSIVTASSADESFVDIELTQMSAHAVYEGWDEGYWATKYVTQ